MKKPVEPPNVIRAIKRNYLNVQQALIEELFMSIEKHAPTLGSHRELVWKQFFERILPKKFTVEQSAFIIDSYGSVSKETDLVIFDEQYMPYIFRNRNIKYIPIEAVMAVVQCKSTSFNQNVTKNISAWLDSFKNLEPSSAGWAGTVTGSEVIKNTRKVQPLKIVCGLFKPTLKNIETFVQNNDCHLLIYANQYPKNGSLNIYRKYSKLLDFLPTILPTRTEEKWKDYSSICTEYWNVYQNENSKHELMGLLTLVFELNQYLMCINNPMLFPHCAYVKMFNKPECNLNDDEAQNHG